MTELPSVALIGLGEAGLILAEDLLAVGVPALTLWDCQFGVADSIPEHHWALLAADARVRRATGAVTAALGCQLVLSAVTADQAEDAARSVLLGLAPDTWYLDINSVSPATKQALARQVTDAGGRFVEAAVMAPISPQRSGAPVLLAGPWAEAFAPLGRRLGFSNLRVSAADYGVAAATKMCRSLVVKGLEALVTEALLAARAYGVEDAVLASLDNLLTGADWEAQAHYLLTRSLRHGIRRGAEMREVAKTVAEAGQQPWMSEACARRQTWAGDAGSTLDAGPDADLTALLDALRGCQLHRHSPEENTASC